jgi:hypothetical protein
MWQLLLPTPTPTVFSNLSVFNHGLPTPRPQKREKGRPVYAHGRWSVLGSFYVALCSHGAGASGTGRTTFVNTLCESEVLSPKVADNAETAHIEEGIRIKPVNVG